MKWTRYFIPAAGAILLMAALTRFLIAVGNAQVLSLPEPLLGIPMRYAVLLVGALDLAVALVCLFGKRFGLQISWLAWLGLNYLIFWVALLLQRCSPQATCIGNLTNPLRLYHGTTGYLLQFMPFYLLVGSCIAAASMRFSSEARTARLAEARQLATQHDAAAGLMKMICPACGGHVKFAASNIGQQIPCPHCKTAVVLRKPDENLRMVCFFCKGHIEFPAHALGQKLQCPHCHKDIMLKEPAIA